MLTVVFVVLFAVSQVATWETIYRRTQVDVVFLPGLTIGCQVTALFLAGLLHVLRSVSLALGAAGLVLFGYYLLKDHKLTWLKKYLTPGMGYLVLSLIVLAVFLQGKYLSHFDDYTHWAVIVKQMLMTDRLPTAVDTLITFRSYPPGSALYIYFFCKLTSSGESVQIIAQIYMMLAFMVPVFYYCKRMQPVTVAFVLLLTNFFFVYNVEITSLVVDTLLPIVAMGTLVYAKVYGAAQSWNISRMLPLAACMVLIVLIKNSGVFFALWIFVVFMVGGGIKRKDYGPCVC